MVVEMLVINRIEEQVAIDVHEVADLENEYSIIAKPMCDAAHHVIETVNMRARVVRGDECRRAVFLP